MDAAADHFLGPVVEIVTVIASWNNSKPQLSTIRPQLVQYKTVNFTRFQHISTNAEKWFGTRESEVHILSSRPYFQSLANQRSDPLGLAQVFSCRKARRYWASRCTLNARASTETSTVGRDDPVLHPDSQAQICHSSV
jgi:hypothetical protein